VELVPGHNGANIHEASQVKEHIQARTDFVVSLLAFFQELAVPVQCASSDEACQDVIGSKRAACTEDEKLSMCQPTLHKTEARD
jgi:hypothetical protein